MLIGRPAVKALLQQESVKKNNSFFKREIKPLEYKLTILLLRAESRLQLTNFLIKLKNSTEKMLREWRNRMFWCLQSKKNN